MCSANVRSDSIVIVEGGGGQIVRAVAKVSILGQQALSYPYFKSLLASLGRNQVYNACCSVQTTHKPV